MRLSLFSLKRITRWAVAFLALLMTLTLSACASTTSDGHRLSMGEMSYLQQGKHYFKEGEFKKSLNMLLPLACDGVAEAQYAVGYMYYYGYGVAEDTDVGLFWIKRSASQQFKPAIDALELIKYNTAQRKAKMKKHYSDRKLHRINLAMAGESFARLEKLKSELDLTFSQPIVA